MDDAGITSMLLKFRSRQWDSQDAAQVQVRAGNVCCNALVDSSGEHRRRSTGEIAGGRGPSKILFSYLGGWEGGVAVAGLAREERRWLEVEK